MLNFGQSHGLNFEISLIEIYLVFFALINLGPIWRNRRNLIKNKAVRLIFTFCLLSTISLFWAPNLIKGVLISGIIWLLFVCFLAFLSYKNLPKIIPALLKILIISACLMAIFGLFQMFAEIIGLPQSVSLLCDGCLANQFGFARVTGFTIEPQFFGSLLLIPILLLLQKFINHKNHHALNICLVLLLVAVFLTMSRGAIYALATGVIALIIINWQNFKKGLIALLIIIGSFVLTLSIQGISAQLNPRINDNFYAAVSRTIHQLSLGIIDIRSSDHASSSETPSSDAPIQGGYVEDSTDTRNFLSRLALEIWPKTPTNIILGTGIGSTGFILHHYFPDQIGDTEIAQNQYVETLLENGLIGLILFVILIILLFRISHKYKFLWAIFVAFLIQWYFFSGYPNALHVYLFCLICSTVVLSLTSKPAYAKLTTEKPYEKQKAPKEK